MTKRAFVVTCIAVVLVIAGTGAASGLPDYPSSAFESASGCGCHPALSEQWSRSMHAGAVRDPIFRYKMGEAVKALPALGPFCNGCHTPVGVMSGEIAGPDTSTASPVAMEGVTCDFCHQVSGTAGPLGNTSVQITVEKSKTRRAQLKDAVSPSHLTAYSQFHETAEFCGNCHNVDHPINGMHLEATYTEWKNSPYAEEGIVCQDCHMTPGPGVTKPNPGKAAGMGPARDHIYTMTFVGANAALGDAAAAEANLKAAARLDLEVEEIVAAGAMVPVKTTITNVGAGHYLPTGLTEVRQMWLEVTATDASGNELARERRDFGTVLKDADGKYPVEMWEGVGIQSDDRIPPRESTSNEYSFPMPDGPVTVTAALYYRTASEEYATAAGIEIPTITMATAATTVYTSAEQKAAGAPDRPEDDADDGASPLLTILLLAAALALIVAAAVFLLRKKRA